MSVTIETSDTVRWQQNHTSIAGSLPSDTKIPAYSVVTQAVIPKPSYRTAQTSVTITIKNNNTVSFGSNTMAIPSGSTPTTVTISLNYPASQQVSFYADKLTATVSVRCNSSTGLQYGAKCSITYNPHAITWTTNPSITSQVGDSITVSMKAKDNYLSAGGSGNITYSFYVDDVLNTTTTGASDAAVSKTLTGMPGGTHTLKVIPSFGGLNGEAKTASFTVDSHKTVKYYNGSQWIECIPYVYTNGSFVEVEPHYYDGSQWILCSH